MTKDEIQEIGKDVIDLVIKDKKKINDAICSKVGSNWTAEQVKRLVEFVNTTLFNVYYKKLSDKKFAFELADFETISKKVGDFKESSSKVASFANYSRAITEEIERHGMDNIDKVASALFDINPDNPMVKIGKNLQSSYGFEDYKVAKCIDDMCKKALAPTGARLKQTSGMQVGGEIKKNNLSINKIQSPAMAPVKLGEELDKVAFFDPSMALDAFAQPVAAGIYGGGNLLSMGKQRTLENNLIGKNNPVSTPLKIRHIGNEVYKQIKNNFVSPVGMYGNVDFRNRNI